MDTNIFCTNNDILNFSLKIGISKRYKDHKLIRLGRRAVSRRRKESYVAEIL